jgi:hypothetical protein
LPPETKAISAKSAASTTQAAKTTLFAAGNEGDVCKKRRQATFCQ